MPQKTIYVKDADLPTWLRAEKAVKIGAAADSVSGLIADALRLYLAQFGDHGGGLYVKAPDDEETVPFDAEISAVLEKDAASGTWLLRLDPRAYPEADSSRSLGQGMPGEMVAAARGCLAEALSQGALERAAARLRRALGIGAAPSAEDGRLAGRSWALERATPGELEAVCELARTQWSSIAAGPGGSWPTLFAEVGHHRPHADTESDTGELRRDEFLVGFVEEACAVYEQILETDLGA
jgi:hypothetical protein